MNKEKIINYWLTAAKQDFETAELLFKNKRYHYSLFFCHISIEKILKGIFVKNIDSAPPFTHDLLRLAEQASIPLTTRLKNELAEITTFNIEARYDDYKLSFYKKATESFSGKYIKITKRILKWLNRLT